jgi:hypothetical protein
MTKRELLEALKKTTVPEDTPVMFQDDAGY